MRLIGSTRMVTVIPAGERFSPAQLYKSAAIHGGSRFKMQLQISAFSRLKQLVRDYRLGSDNKNLSDEAVRNAQSGDTDSRRSGGTADEFFVAEFRLEKFAESSFFASDPGDNSGELANSASGIQGSKTERAAATPIITASGEFQAVLDLQCQRCLGTCRHEITTSFRFAFAANELTADLLPDSYDPVLLDEDGHLDGVGMFEDELLLRLPTHAMHADLKDCDQAEVPYQDHLVDPAEAKPESPFAALKGLSFRDS